MTGHTATDPPFPELPAYAIARPHRVKRVKLALFLSSLAACVGVAIIGFLTMAAGLIALGIAGHNGGLAIGNSDFGGGALLAAQLSSMNFVLFFVTVPAAALALGLSIARFPGRGITGVTPICAGARYGAPSWWAERRACSACSAGPRLLPAPSSAGRRSADWRAPSAAIFSTPSCSLPGS